MYQADRLIPSSGMLLTTMCAFALCVGCGGGEVRGTESCRASDNSCISDQADEHPTDPVHETGREFHALRLGDDQCNIRANGNHLGNPTVASGSPVILDAAGTRVISSLLSECTPFQFFMNYCNFGVSASDALQDTWILSDSDQTLKIEQIINIPSLASCACMSVSVPVPGLPSQSYVLESVFHPGGSFHLALRFSVAATLGGVERCP
jgi:hypothetical protein